MAKVEGKQYILAQKICEAFGLDPGEVISLKLTFAAGGIAQVEVVLYPDKEHLDLVVPILKQYKLVPKKE